MIPAELDYARPTTLEEAVELLAEYADDAKILAGGQSLIPLLRFRLAYPTVLVDVGRIHSLHGVREEHDHLVIGALTTHHQVMTDPLVRRFCPLLAQATTTVGDPAVRHRGTLGGSLAHADPAGDLPAVALALGAEMVLHGEGGRRTVAADDFFVDYLHTVLAPEEVLVAVNVPKLGPGWGVRYEKFNRVAQAWAVVGVAAAVRRENGSIAEARIGLTNMGATPVRAFGVEAALQGRPATREAIATAVADVAQGLNPPSDLGGGAAYRRHLAGVLTRRAVSVASGISDDSGSI